MGTKQDTNAMRSSCRYSCSKHFERAAPCQQIETSSSKTRSYKKVRLLYERKPYAYTSRRAWRPCNSVKRATVRARWRTTWRVCPRTCARNRGPPRWRQSLALWAIHPSSFHQIEWVHLCGDKKPEAELRRQPKNYVTLLFFTVDVDWALRFMNWGSSTEIGPLRDVVKRSLISSPEDGGCDDSRSISPKFPRAF